MISNMAYNPLLKWITFSTCVLLRFPGVEGFALKAGDQLNSLHNHDSTFIVGGTEALPHEFPWQVSIRSNLADQHLCGGVIIDAYTVLTTALCSELITAHSSTVAAGKHNLSEVEVSQQVVQVSSKHVHPAFPGSTDYSNDIAVLKLSPALMITEYVSPVPKLQDSQIISTEVGLISGWGTKKEEEISLQESLHKVTVKLIENMDCQLLVGSLLTVEDSMICITSPNPGTPVDSCTGDHGGPLITTSESGTVSLIGLISFGIGCGRPNLPSFCTRISSYIDFIRQYQET